MLIYIKAPIIINVNSTFPLILLLLFWNRFRLNYQVESYIMKEIINFIKQNDFQTKEVHLHLYIVIWCEFMVHWMGLFLVDRWRTYAVFMVLKDVHLRRVVWNWKYLLKLYYWWWYYKLNTRFLYRLHLYIKSLNVYCFFFLNLIYCFWWAEQRKYFFF